MKQNNIKTSSESLVIGILAFVSSILFFFLVPRKPFGLNLIKPIDAVEDFSRYVFFLFIILILGVITVGLSGAAIIFGIKDYRGDFRGIYAKKGRAVYLIGASLGILSIIFFTCFLVWLFLF